jgi:hypothetical protein
LDGTCINERKEREDGSLVTFTDQQGQTVGKLFDGHTLFEGGYVLSYGDDRKEK